MIVTVIRCKVKTNVRKNEIFFVNHYIFPTFAEKYQADCISAMTKTITFSDGNDNENEDGYEIFSKTETKNKSTI